MYKPLFMRNVIASIRYVRFLLAFAQLLGDHPQSIPIASYIRIPIPAEMFRERKNIEQQRHEKIE